MKLLFKNLVFILIGTLSFSCHKDSSQEKLLVEAQSNLITHKPDVALSLLTSIQNPKDMDKSRYMEYIVALVGAKKETRTDISKEVLIFEAQNYFNDKNDYKNSSLANFYAGWVYYENNDLLQSLESFMYAANASDKSKDYLLAAKSFNNIGYVYFEQDLFDSAIVNYKKALIYYDNLKDVSQLKVETFTNIGRSFDEMNQLDSAYIYFEKSLSLAKEMNNDIYYFHSLKNLGAVCLKIEDYDKAVHYFESALAMGLSDKEEVIKTNIALLKTYNKKRDTKSAKQYVAFITSALTDVSYIYTQKEMYSSLADYYTLTNDYKTALEYRDLEKATLEKIGKESVAPALLVADKNFYLDKKDREVHSLVSKICFFLILGAVVICAALILGFFVWNNNKKHKKEIAGYAEKYEILKGMLFSMRDEYPKIEAEIKSILE